MCSKLSVHLNGGCSTVGSPAVGMEGSGGPRQPVLVLVSKQGYRRDPGSRAKGEGTTGAPACLRWWQGASSPLCSAKQLSSVASQLHRLHVIYLISQLLYIIFLDLFLFLFSRVKASQNSYNTLEISILPFP